MIRAYALAAALAAAAPAAAQAPPAGLDQMNMLWAEQQMARMREISAANEMMALEARLSAGQAIAEVRAQQAAPALPQPDEAHAAGYRLDPSSLASIPDDRLAASNRRVQDAVAARR